ncbi:bifunctional tetrahydrofolate synthase/dihydrofolate synthase [Marinobacter fonticola]|uniref:bifunctional tetrahydrofolate synthase/dihydrofolate synthase n=1 Tax=Marinobacter fonticola TaxID=2603215 RepID=UPI0011E84F3D|nr:bifunctional tetrahydrofolate synthase/dihydrofolate synthase [Marinobacter fonticola]
MLQAPETGATVDQWLDYLEALHPKEIDLGLDRVLMVLRRLFPRHPGARIVTVGGTNGKGTTVAALEQLLLASDRAVGAYTSPHLQHYNERIRINGVDVSDNELVAAFEAVEHARKSVSLTYFEFGTLAAFVLFDRAGLDDWLLEVGLGGRLDAVNVLDADLAIITSVDLDHTAWLGEDRDTIGYEKAGILRHGQKAVYGDLEPPRSVLQQIAAQGVDCYRLGEQYRLVEGEQGSRVVTDAGGHWAFRLPDNGLPEHSLAAAVQAFRLLQPDEADSRIEHTLTRVRVPGRFEQVADAPRIIIDVGHNPHAAQWLRQRVEALGVEGRIKAVYACLEDKDSGGVLRAMAPVVDDWYLAPLSVPRGLDRDSLHRRAQDVSSVAETMVMATSVAAALAQARADADPKDCILVFGSFFTVSEARSSLNC